MFYELHSRLRLILQPLKDSKNYTLRQLEKCSILVAMSQNVKISLRKAKWKKGLNFLKTLKLDFERNLIIDRWFIVTLIHTV